MNGNQDQIYDDVRDLFQGSEAFWSKDVPYDFARTVSDAEHYGIKFFDDKGTATLVGMLAGKLSCHTEGYPYRVCLSTKDLGNVSVFSLY